MTRKTALEQFHRNLISEAALKLFMLAGTEKTTMDDIAKESQYSKATLYVYFKSKDEILNYITLKGMKTMLDKFTAVISNGGSVIEQYYSICEAMADFHDESPIGFSVVLGTIRFDEDSRKLSPILEEIYETGEALNAIMLEMLGKAAGQGIINEGSCSLNTGMIFWFALAGIISFSDAKRDYIFSSTGVNKNELRREGYSLLLRSILKDK